MVENPFEHNKPVRLVDSNPFFSIMDWRYGIIKKEMSVITEVTSFHEF